jgi:predicted 3-demethylubiquinone-9 3-methyltransferase (glyoxalase superfamily)
MQKIITHLWFDDQAEEAARFYTSIFKNARLGRITHYGKSGERVAKRPAGSVMTVEFELDGKLYHALNAGPLFKLNEAFSLYVDCDDQAEVDHYWSKLLEGGGAPQQCGWLKDRFGVCWQIVPSFLTEVVHDPDPAKVERVMEAMFAMKKLDLATLERAARG